MSAELQAPFFHFFSRGGFQLKQFKVGRPQEFAAFPATLNYGPIRLTVRPCAIECALKNVGLWSQFHAGLPVRAQSFQHLPSPFPSILEVEVSIHWPTCLNKIALLALILLTANCKCDALWLLDLFGRHGVSNKRKR
jgi:hypothetical protein